MCGAGSRVIRSPNCPNMALNRTGLFMNSPFLLSKNPFSLCRKSKFNSPSRSGMPPADPQRRAKEEPETMGLRPESDLRVIKTKHKQLLRDYSAPLRSLPSQITSNKERKRSIIRFSQPILKAVPLTFTVRNTQHCTAEQERPSRQCRVIVRWIAKCTYEVRLGFVDVQ